MSTVTSSMSALSASASSQICSTNIDFMSPEEFVDIGVDDVERLAELHVAEADVGAVVERHVGALLQGDLVDRAAHPGQRQR